MRFSWFTLLPVALASSMLCAGVARGQAAGPAEWRAAEKKVNETEVPQEKAVGEKRERDEAAAMLRKAVKAMKTGVWHVNAVIQERVFYMALQRQGAWQPYDVITGLFAGADYDLVDFNAGTRRIGVGGTQWSSTDGGRTWVDGKKETPMVFAGLDLLDVMSQKADLKCESLGRQQLADGTWLHVRTVETAMTPVDYWLLLDAKGEPVMVRHVEMIMECPIVTEMRTRSYLYTLDISPANGSNGITAPVMQAK